MDAPPLSDTLKLPKRGPRAPVVPPTTLRPVESLPHTQPPVQSPDSHARPNEGNYLLYPANSLTTVTFLEGNGLSNDPAWLPLDDEFPSPVGYTGLPPQTGNLADVFQFSPVDDLPTCNELSLVTDATLLPVTSLGVSDMWQSIQRFFDTMYIVFPVLSYHTLLSRLIMEPAWASNSELRTLLVSIRMLNCASEYRMAPENEISLFSLIREVERSRLSYEFAEPPTLDEVVVSLFLFTAYNVLERHSRAFLYLDEALSLIEAVESVGDEEERRKRRISQVLYNTEAASLAIYAGNNRQRRARKPSMAMEDLTTVPSRIENNREADQMAMHLLRRLTEIHLADDTEALRIINTASEADMETLFGAAFQRHRYCRIQAADVAVTRQWQLSSKLVTSMKTGATILGSTQSWIGSLGTTAMAWVCLLGEGESRIVGLGKLSGLAQNIYTLAGRRCQYAVGGLVGAIIREDHERKFAPDLANVIMPMVSTVPSAMRPILNHDFEGEEPRSYAPVAAGYDGTRNLDVLYTHALPEVSLMQPTESPPRDETDPDTGEIEEENVDWFADMC